MVNRLCDDQLVTSIAPGNNASAAGYDNPNFYLFSVQTNLKGSVTNSTDVLPQESGSTVKHVN